MNILSIGNNFVRGDGQGRINYEIVKYALRQGHRVTLVAGRVDDDLTRAGAQWVKVQSPIRKPNLANLVFFRRAADAFIAANGKSFDRVIGNGGTLNHPHRLNLCQFVHGAWIKSPVHVAKLTHGPYAWYQWTYSKVNSRWENRSYAMAELVIAPSEKIRQELIGIGVPDEKIRVIYNGVDLNEFRPGEESREELGLPAAKPLALFVGDIRTPRKNLDTTLKAMQNLPGVHLAVAGASARSPFPELARTLGIADRVTFLDFRRDVGKIMRAVDLFIFPSRYEAGTLVLLEALASGLPVVTARTAGGCEVMGDSAGRIIDDPNDVDALAAAIAELAGNEPARKAASIQARTTAEKYSWDSMSAQYLALLEGTAGMTSAAAPILMFSTKGAGSNEELRLQTLLSKHEIEVFPFDRRSKRNSLRSLTSRIKQSRPALLVMEGTGLAGGLACFYARLHGTRYVVSSGDAIGPWGGDAKPRRRRTVCDLRAIAVPVGGWIYRVDAVPGRVVR